MLSNDTRKIIDDARDTLVGQIPVPMMQCQQITLALTYKFMSDDDEQAVDLGGQAHYFIGDLEKYTWNKLVSRRIDDTQRSELYREGLIALRNSETMPAVFREIFLFLQVLALCQQAGLVKLGHVALDGTKVRANASRNKAMSYGRMKEKEAQLKAEVAELLRKAGEVDDDEDHRYGRDKRGDELPEELAFRESRLRKIREARAALEAEALAEAEQAEREGRNHPGVPDDKAQRNFTDPDSRIMPGPGGRDFQQSYNCQAVVDSSHQVIVAARATDQPSDKRQAVVMVEETIGNVGAVPKEVSADAGYYSAKAVDGLYDLGVDPFVAPEKTRHGRVLEPAPRGRIPQGLSPRDRMRRKLRTKRGRERYALRMETVEPVFGQIKQGRGFRQFLLRGLEKVNSEWSLICTGHNLLKLFRFGEGKPGKARATGPAGNNRDWHGTATRGIFRLLTAYTCPPRTRTVAVGWFHLYSCQSAIPRTGC